MTYRLRIWELTSEDTIALTDHFFNTESEPMAWAEANNIEHYEARDGAWQLISEKDLESVRRREDGTLRHFSGPVTPGN